MTYLLPVPHPALVHDGFVALGVTVGLVVFLAEARRRRMWDDRLIPVIAGLLVGGAVGARLAGVLEAATSGGTAPSALAWAWAEGGRSILGGLSGAYAGALIGKRLGGYRGRTGDLFAPAVVLGLAVGRIGCLLTEAPGRPTSLPWGIRMDPAAGVPECPGCDAGLAMHPSYLYEIVFLLLLYVVLRSIRARVVAPGELFVLFLAAYAVFRFGVEFTRANPPDVLGLTRSQVFLLVMAPLLAWRVVRAARDGVYDRILPRPRRPVREPA